MVGRANSSAAEVGLRLARFVAIGVLASLLPGVAASAQTNSGPIVPDVQEAEFETEVEAGAEPDSETEPEWNPIPPDSPWDWIMLSSDEWLRGSVLRMRDLRLEFDSERIKEKTFKWKHIKEIHSPRPLVWRFKRGVILIGPGVMKGDTVTVDVYGTTHVMPKADLVAILPGAEKEANRWRAKAALNVALRAGNTEQFDVGVDAWVRRETARTRLHLDYSSAFGTVNDEETKNTQRGTARLDIYRTSSFFVIPGLVEAFHDPFSNIDIRTTASLGVGYHLFWGAFDWVVFATTGYQYQGFSSTVGGLDPDDHNGVVVLGTDFEWEITGDLSWNTDYQLQLTFPTLGDTNQRLTTKLKYELTRLLFLETTFGWDRVEQPRTGADGTVPKSDDLRLTVGFGVQY